MRISVYRKGVRPWPEVEIHQATNEDLLSFINTESASHDISDDLDDAVWDEALRRMTGSASQLAELLEKLQDPEIVHSYILRGRIQLTRAQAIHIAGLPWNIDSQVAQLQAQLKQIAALEARNRELREKVRACIDRHQDIFSWQKGESRNGLVAEIRDKVDAIFAALAARVNR